VVTLETQCASLTSKIAELKPKAAQAARKWEASSSLVEQFKASLIEAGKDCPDSTSGDDILAPTQKPGIGPIVKMYYSNVQKLSSYAASKAHLEGKLEQTSRHLRGCTFQLTCT
jgi:hypothetical protein